MFVKHIGKHNNRKVAIVFRQVPDEEHMALVCYTETLPAPIHDAIINVVESAPGQATDNLSDVLHRNFLPDGRGILEALHKEGMLKKVPTSQVIVTPNKQSHVRLDELNKIINDLLTGNEAADKMRELDENAGMVDPSQKRQAPEPEVVREVAEPEVLDDATLARNLMEQAKQLAIEVERLTSEAYNLDPSLKPKAPVKKKVSKKKASTAKKKSTGSTKVSATTESTATIKSTYE